MQILISKTYQLTLFEVPKIAVNTIELKDALQNDELKSIEEDFKAKNFNPQFECQIEESFAKHEDITLIFKKQCKQSFEETMKWFLSQMEKAQKKQDTRKLGMLSQLMLSRLMPKIHGFYKSDLTSVHGTEFNWNVIIGPVT